MRLTIEASVGRIPQRDLCVRAAGEAFSMLERIARQRRRLSRWYREMPNDLDDRLARKMTRSVLAVDPGLTPMAAVAGTISDGVASFLHRRGMDRVIVNNGGDIAVRTGPGVSVNVGIRPDLSGGPVAEIVALGDERAAWGVATSGLEGRSFSRGVASAVTIFAGSASIADAAATSVANASFVADETVVQRPAEELDDQTDIPGVAVTVRAGPFTEEKKDLALSRALERAKALANRRLIYGAYIVVDGKVAMTEFVHRRRIQPAGEENANGCQKIRRSG